MQNALRLVIEPIFEQEFAAHSYGFRPGRGCKDALRRVDALLGEGHGWVVDADRKGYIGTIPHQRLTEMVESQIADDYPRNVNARASAVPLAHEATMSSSPSRSPVEIFNPDRLLPKNAVN